LLLAATTILLAAQDPALPGEVPFEQLKDLTGRASAVVTLKGRDNFANEFRYDVSVRNQSNEAFAADSLIIVLDRITDLAGHDFLGPQEFLGHIEVVGYDGQTPGGQFYFRVPHGQGKELPPYSESEPATVRLRNVDYTIVFTPSFRVFGQQPPKPDPAKSLDQLIQTLTKKGVLSEEESQRFQSPSANQP
jgi:hypothetical protein